MKKIFTLTAALTASLIFADVESTNVVGYNGTSLAKEVYYMVTAQFDATSGTGAGMALKDLVTGDIPFGTKMSILKGDGTYNNFEYVEEAYDAELDDFVNGWADVGGDLALNKIEPGTTFWLKAPSAATATIAGQILADASKTIDITGGKYTMIGNPYPVVVNPNELTWTGLTFGDVISVLKEDGTYSNFEYLEESYKADIDDFVPGWGDVGGDYVNQGVIPVAQGAWIKAQADLTLQWKSPLN